MKKPHDQWTSIDIAEYGRMSDTPVFPELPSQDEAQDTGRKTCSDNLWTDFHQEGNSKWESALFIVFVISGILLVVSGILRAVSATTCGAC